MDIIATCLQQELELSPEADMVRKLHAMLQRQKSGLGIMRQN
jgi:hypothetical protein